MSNALAFRDVTFDVQSINNQIYISSAQLAAALGYANENAVTKIYNRNSDEFTDEMTRLPNLGSTANLKAERRVFSLRGAHLVAMFSRTPVAKEFRKWVLDVLDKEINHHPKQSEFDLLNQNVFQKGREAALDFFEKYRDAVSKGKSRPDVDVPEEVLIGILAMSIWKHDFILSFDYDGRVYVRPRPSPYDGLAKAISDPSNIGLKDEAIEEIAQACITALSHRAKHRDALILKLRGAK